MTGHEQLIRVRKHGLKPAGLVYVDDYPVRPVFLDWLQNKTMPTVCTHGADVDALDLRCLLGLSVQVTGGSMARVKKIAAAARKAGADTVFASVGDKCAVWQKGDAEWRLF